VALAAGITALLAVPGAAHAATKTVTMGEPANKVQTFENKYFADANAFFPSSITVHKGDKVRFVPAGFHNLDIPKRGGTPTPLITPQGTVANAVDAAGAPFWFNGMPLLSFNPALGRSRFGKTITYTGRKSVNSGLPSDQGPPKPVTVRFTHTGTFTYYCDIHPGMKGRVRVIRGKAPSRKSDARRVRHQVAQALSTAKKLASAKAPAGTSTISIGTRGAHGVERYAFLPDNLTVPVGATVHFDMPAHSTEDHTATAGPGNPESSQKSYLGDLAASFQSPKLDPAAVYPSEKPGGPSTLNATSHGNGFWNSGVLDADSRTPLPSTSAVTFTQAGTYDFYCLIHPFMKATVTVK
jgi:plastocyanin